MTVVSPYYRLSQLKTLARGLQARLVLDGAPADRYGKDIHDLILEVEYQTESRLHVHIFDAEGKQYQVSEEDLPIPKSSSVVHTCGLRFDYDTDPFAFWITRRADGEVIFDTRIIRNGLVFSDQYLHLATKLPTDANIYGLGEVVASKGFRKDPSDTTITLWSSDSAGTPLDKNVYGSHPFYLEARGDGLASHGVFLRNSHGMDILLRPGTLEYKVLGGTLDFYFLEGPTPKQVVEQYSGVIGRPAKMPAWAFGFHLCRFGYGSLEGTRVVVDRMKAENIPLEVMWSDLEYMDRRRNFTVSPKDFPYKEFKAWLNKLHSDGQHWIPIIDAGIPRNRVDYPLYETGHDLDVFIKRDDGTEFVGEVWPGPTVFPDWSAKNIKKWWKSGFETLHDIAPYDGIWLDMNEPASFSNGFDGIPRQEALVDPDAAEDDPLKPKNKFDKPGYPIHDFWKGLDKHTVPPSCLLADGSRAYNTHNMYGYQETRITHDVLLEQKPGERPFIVSRSTFPGHGSIAAHWLGDNYSTFQYMKASIQGVLDFQLFQIPMVGPDACGFTHDASEELCNRWMMLAAFFPFYRNHNDMRSTSQEPYIWKGVAEASRKYINMRYALLPLWETLFDEAHTHGTPPLRPLFLEFANPAYLSVDAQFLVGSSILVSPVVDEGATEVTAYFPTEGETIWRDWVTHEVVKTNSKGQATLAAPMGHMPVHIRSGSAVLTYTEAKYTVEETRKQPFTLVIFVDHNGVASGVASLDDGISLDSKRTRVTFTVAEGKLSISAAGDYSVTQQIERVQILGLSTRPSEIHFNGNKVEGSFDSKVGTLTLAGLALPLATGASLSWAA